MCLPKKKAIQQHFKHATEYGLVSSWAFWNLVTPIIFSKGGLVGSDFFSFENNEIVTDDQQLTEIFNNLCIK